MAFDRHKDGELAPSHRSQTTLFFVLWTAAVLSDRFVRQVNESWLSIFWVVLGLWFLIRPRSPYRFAAFSLAHLTWYASNYLDGSMIHWTIAAIIHLIYIFSFIAHVLRTRQFPKSNNDLRPSLLPLGRWTFFVAVFAAGFAKLNRGFLDPDLSCASVIYAYQRTVPGFGLFLPDATWGHTFAIWLTVVCELAAPVLLLFSRTRKFGAVLALGFFFLVGINPINKLYEFAGLFVALSMWFAPPMVIHNYLSTTNNFFRTKKLRYFGTSKLSTYIQRFFFQTAIILLLVLLVFADNEPYLGWRHYICRIVWVAGMVGVIFPIVLSWLVTPSTRDSIRSFIPRDWWILAVILLFVANEVTPYLGLKHSPTMTMAGNLNITSEHSNHIIVQNIPNFEFGREVKILSSSDKRLRRGRYMVSLAFFDYLSNNPDTDVRFTIDGKEEHLVSTLRTASPSRLLA